MTVFILAEAEVMQEIRSSLSSTEHLIFDVVKVSCPEEIAESKYSR